MKVKQTTVINQETINGDNLYVTLNFENNGKEIILKSNTSIRYKDNTN